MFKNKIFKDLISQRNLILGYDESKRPIFKPEDDEGYIEYKLRLDQIDRPKIDRMVTQMKYRLNEGKLAIGKYMAYYFLGIDDDGIAGFIDKDILDKTISVIEDVASKSNAEIHSLECVQIDTNKYIAAVCVRKCCSDKYINEYRVVMLGASNHAKTTCISYLTYNEKDNGNGSGRMVIFKHTHEQNTGVTSSIKHDIFGFKNSSVNNYKSSITWDKIVENSSKIISIFDLPGSLKYMRTTTFGISALRADLHVVTISIPDCYNEDKICIPSEITWAIEMSINLKIPIFVLFTKLDIASKKQHDDLIEYISNFIKKFGKNLVCYGNSDTISNDILYLAISNITGENYDKFIQFLDRVSQIKSDKPVIVSNDPEKVDFMIYDVINIREIGYIVSGIVISNSIKVGDKLFIGPIEGRFYPISVKSIRKKQLESNVIYPGESGSIEIKLKLDDIQSENNLNNIEIDKHMNILDEKTINKLTDYVYVKTNTIKNLIVGHQYMIYIDNLIEPAILTSIDNDNNICNFKFVKAHKVYVRSCTKCIIKSDPNYDFCVYGTCQI